MTLKYQRFYLNVDKNTLGKYLVVAIRSKITMLLLLADYHLIFYIMWF